MTDIEGNVLKPGDLLKSINQIKYNGGSEFERILDGKKFSATQDSILNFQLVKCKTRPPSGSWSLPIESFLKDIYCRGKNAD